MVPAARASWVQRPRLVQHLTDSLDEHRVVLLCAGAGFGKTTLAAQFCAAARPGTTAWIACEASDRDPARFFGLLISSLGPMSQGWDLRPAELVASFASGADGRGSATAELIERLADLDVPQFVWVWDDFHLAANEAVCAWVASFVERLPPHVRCLLLVRDTPALPLARWRARGDLTEITEIDLRFTADESRTMLDGASVHAAVDALIARANGWAAGLRLLGSSRAGPVASAGFVTGLGTRHLFDYLADEVFDRLPAALQSFLMDACVLAEWSPDVCAAVLEQPEAATVLHEVMRRNLPVRVVDAQAPVLRPDDLFRDFLSDRLRRTDGARLRALTQRAALHESDPIRRVRLLLDSTNCEAAARELAASIDAILETMSSASVRGLADALGGRLAPDDASLAYVRGVLAFRRLAFDEAWQQLEIAGRSAQPIPASRRARALVMASRACSYMGRIDDARRLVAAARASDPAPDLSAEIDIESAWLATASCELDTIVSSLTSAIGTAEQLASLELCGRLAERIRGLYFGFAGSDALFRRFHALVMRLNPGAVSHTMAHAQLLRTWAALSEGDFCMAHELIGHVEEANERLGRPRALAVDLAIARALLAAVEGDGKAAAELLAPLAPPDSDAPRHAARVWHGVFVYLQARACWITGDDAGLRAAHRRLLATPRDGEWPPVAVLRELADAYVASRSGDAPRAAQLFARCVEGQRRCPMRPASDARIGLACELARLGRPRDAWQAVEPMLTQALVSGSIGPLLFESSTVLGTVAGLVPRADARRAELLALIERATRIRQPDGMRARAPSPALADLTARENEVLALIAAGASNKRIALRLDISLHTVKRHVANIIGKLGVQSRGEAAARFNALGA